MRTKKTVSSFLAAIFSLSIVLPGLAKADAAPVPVTINFDVEAPGSGLFNGPLSVPDCVTPNNATSTVNGFCAFAAAGLTADPTWSASGVVINSINGNAGDWQWSLNGAPQTASFDSYAPQTGDNVLWSIPAPPQQHVTLTIRDGGVTAFTGSVALPDQSAPNISVTPTNTTTPVSVSPRSMLGVLEALEASSTSFNITDLSYYPPSTSFPAGSFLINCIAVPSTSTVPDCFNWTYAVNASYPQVGVDQKILNDGDTIYLFFGPSHQTIVSASSVTAGQPFTATAQQYDLTSGTYKPLTGVTLAVGTPNPYPTPFAEIATSTVDSNGQAVFTINTTGKFSVGIKEDFYFPAVVVTINSAPSGSGGGGGISHSTLNIPAALTFIANSQNTDGSFGSPIVTDWTAVAFAAVDPGPAKTKLHDYLLAAAPSLSAATDYERHAMALEALGINPYSGTAVNYIAPITAAFDGTQIGSSALDNDDIFGLLALEHAGYTSGDPIIQKTAAFILSGQKPDGSWDETPDMTAAAIQALGGLFDLPGVNAALGQAAGYLASSEKPDGSWSNIDSTSWVQTAINAIIEAHTPGFDTENPWMASSGFFPTDVLAQAQVADGGVQSPNRVWSTAYAVTAASGKSWVTVLHSFPKPASPAGGGGGSVFGSASASSTASSTLPTLATTTPTSTTTPEIATGTIPTLPIVLPSVAPTATEIILPAPKPKIYKKIVKIQNTPAAPQVLGASIGQPAAPATPTPPEPPAAPANSPGFFSRVWHSITSFFGHIF